MTLLDKAKAKAEQVARDLGHTGPFEWERIEREHGSYMAQVNGLLWIGAHTSGIWTLKTNALLPIGGGRVTEEKT